MFNFGNSVNGVMSNYVDEAFETMKFLQKTSDVMLGDLKTEIATTPFDVVYEQDRVRLKHYKPTRKKKGLKKPLLIVYALINRETMLDLQPGRSVVETFLDEGIDIYMIDWGYPTKKDKYLTIDDHVNGYIDDVVDFILDETKNEKINLMGICMGGTFCTMYSALHPDKINSLVTTVTPTNFDTDQGLLHSWMRDIDIDNMVETFGNMPGDLMNFGFLLLNPARLMIDKYHSFAENMNNKTFVENFVRMEKWIFDSPDVPGETFRQFIKDCYQENLLIKSEMEIGGKKIEMKNITMPLLNIYGKFDHLVPPEACDKLTSVIGSEDKTDVCLETGHIGIYVSSKYQKEFAPSIAGWLKNIEKNNNSGAKKKSTAA